MQGGSSWGTRGWENCSHGTLREGRIPSGKTSNLVNIYEKDDLHSIFISPMASKTFIESDLILNRPRMLVKICE